MATLPPYAHRLNGFTMGGSRSRSPNFATEQKTDGAVQNVLNGDGPGALSAAGEHVIYANNQGFRQLGEDVGSIIGAYFDEKDLKNLKGLLARETQKILTMDGDQKSYNVNINFTRGGGWLGSYLAKHGVKIDKEKQSLNDAINAVVKPWLEERKVTEVGGYAFIDFVAGEDRLRFFLEKFGVEKEAAKLLNDVINTTVRQWLEDRCERIKSESLTIVSNIADFKCGIGRM